MTLTKLKNKKYLKKQTLAGGYTLVELLFYIALFSVLSLTVINSLVTMTKAFKETTIKIELKQGGDILERMSREIRYAVGINTISASDLKLNTKDDVGADKTVRFLLSGTNVQFFENDVLTGNLNSPNMTVTALTFTQITTTAGNAVKIALIIKSNNDALNRTETFYNTVVLRGDY